MPLNKPYLSDDEEFDDFEDYDEHLGKCKQHINNVAVAKKTMTIPTKVIQIPKIAKKKQPAAKPQANLNNDINSITVEEPVKVERELVDDWEDLM